MKRLLTLFLIGLLSAQGASLICYDPGLEGIYQACAVKNGVNLTILGGGFFRVALRPRSVHPSEVRFQHLW